MAVSRAHRSSDRGVLPSALFVGALMVASINTLASAAGEPRARVSPVQGIRAAADYAWSQAQVAELIEEIMAARALGFDPDDYGVAALRGQLTVTSDLMGTAGSRQLDSLADAAALGLARDYRAGRSAVLGSTVPISTDGDRAALRAALRSGTLRGWLQGQRRAQPRLRHAHQTGGA